ncbi:hypothetical protein [Nocardia arizonensis]|uniref:hypothetical protein n=1 Tax=Nocardia arizonensis TaxID=1141647 RepID=UPI0012E13431
MATRGRDATNIVYFRVEGTTDHGDFVRLCAASGLALLALEPGWVRAVFHSGVSAVETVRAADIALTTAETAA